MQVAQRDAQCILNAQEMLAGRGYRCLRPLRRCWEDPFSSLRLSFAVYLVSVGASGGTFQAARDSARPTHLSEMRPPG